MRSRRESHIGPLLRGRSQRSASAPERLRKARERLQVRLNGIRGGGFYRLALLTLGVWGAYTLVGSGNGLLRLRALNVEEAGLQQTYDRLEREKSEVDRLVQEDERLRHERGIREKYRLSRPGEIVYELRRDARGDSATLLIGPGAPGGRANDEGVDAPSGSE